MNELDLFLENNKIDSNKLMEALHLDIRELLLKEICEQMKANDTLRIKVKKKYFLYSDLEATKKVVNFICKCRLSDSDLIWMNKCIKAFLDKTDKRKAISDIEKNRIINKQNNKCALCGKELMPHDIHIDHIIPWDYVGDELEDNYQALCSDCNLHKSNHVAIAVSNIILHKMEA